jgi:mannose/fructose/N-acetylgalactosamine-specific phosphotransferase system component IIC
MEYIIDPAWVYWINVAGDIKIVCVIFAVVAGIVAIIGGVEIVVGHDFGPEDEDYRLGKKILTIAVPVAIACTVAFVFIPSTKVLVEMMVAKVATKENIELTVEGLKSVVDYIAETIKSIK